MDKTVLFFSCFMLFGTFISSLSQIVLKKSAMKDYDSVIMEYLNFPVIGAYSLFFVATLCSIIAYKGVPLSMGPILEATSYVYVTIFGVKIFHEMINIKRILALILIVIGIAMYSIFG